MSEGTVFDITDKLLPEIEDRQDRPLSAAYVVLTINEDGHKKVLSIVIGENKSGKYWLSVLYSLKSRGVQDILILCSMFRWFDRTLK